MPTLNLLYQSQNNPNERNRPRTRTFDIRSAFLRKKKHKRGSEWWSDGTTITQNTRPEAQGGETLATKQSNKGTELTSIPSSSTAKPSRIVVWEHHSSAMRAVAPSLTPQPPALSPFPTRSYFSGRFSSRISRMPMDPPSSRDRSPPRSLDHGGMYSPTAQYRSPPMTPGRAEEGRVNEPEATPLPSPADSQDTPLSPAWPFTQTYDRTGTVVRDSEASLEPPPILSPPPWHRNTFGRMEQQSVEIQPR